MDLSDRMKLYEQSSRMTLPPRMPVIIRVDGKAFHTYTRGCEKPFDQNLHAVMNQTADALCREIQGAQFAYVQSDEISILIHNYKKLNTSAWFDNQVQKMVSVAAACASVTFSINSSKIWRRDLPVDTDVVSPEFIKPALFDARVFVLPEAEVCNYFIWRQQDARRNSVQMLARSMFSQKEMQNKSTLQLQQDMFDEHETRWSNLPTHLQHGRCVVKKEGEVTGADHNHPYTAWRVDNEIPLFTDNRTYVERYLKVEDE